MVDTCQLTCVVIAAESITHLLLWPMQLIKRHYTHQYIVEPGEGHHLNSEAGDTAAPSVERLSFIGELNHHGSLTSLHDISHRRSSAFELKPNGSASKDLLRSALEAHHYRISNPQLNRKSSVGMWTDLWFIFMIHIYMSALCSLHTNGHIMVFLCPSFCVTYFQK
jgi:hypothetical protein